MEPHARCVERVQNTAGLPQKDVGLKGEPGREWLLSQRRAAKNGVLKTMNSTNQDTGFDEYLFRSDALTVFEQRHPQHAGTAVCRA
jgi:hypothetical protein